METHFFYSKSEFDKYFGKKQKWFRNITISLFLFAFLKARIGNLEDIITSTVLGWVDFITAIACVTTLFIWVYYADLRIRAKKSTLTYNNGMIKYHTVYPMRKRYGNKDYYIDNIHGVVNEGAYLIVYGNIRMVDISGCVSEKNINEVKILKCFEGLEEFLTKMGYMDSHSPK